MFVILLVTLETYNTCHAVNIYGGTAHIGTMTQKSRYTIYVHEDKMRAARNGGLKNLSGEVNTLLDRWANNSPVIVVRKKQ
jgi:hypothetical protein